jgi:hypothetical protein
MGITICLHDRVHETRTAGVNLHPAWIMVLGHVHEVSWAWPSTFMATAPSFRGTRASEGRVTMTPHAAGMRSHDGGMKHSHRIHEPSWIRESTFMAVAPSFIDA